MASKVSSSKIKKSIKPRFNKASSTKISPQILLCYKLFLRSLAKAAAEKAREDKSSVVRSNHIKEVSKCVLKSFRG